MVLKKRSSAVVEEREPKKKRKHEKEEPSDKKSKRNKAYAVKVSKEEIVSDIEEDEDVDVEPEEVDDPVMEQKKGSTPWPEADMVELFNRIEALIPADDALVYKTRMEHLNWEEIAFNNYTPSECRTMWGQVLEKVRKYRVLKEVVSDARQWLRKPWTNFYSSTKQNQHPEMPKRPLTQYMLYYMEKKDKIAAIHPSLEMTALSKVISTMYKQLPPEKKEKYCQKAATLREEYEEKLRQFYNNHPECLESKSRKSKGLPGGLKKPRFPRQIFIEDRLAKQKDNPNFDKTAATENARILWKNLSDKKKLVWINWAVEEENKYLDALKLYMAENPSYQPAPHKTVLKKEELVMKDRAAGKPAKPPNSAYSLYSRIMLAKCPKLKELVPKDRMKEIAIRWAAMSEDEKSEYNRKVEYEQQKYKLEYATYLDSLPEEERQEELLKTQSRKKQKEIKEAEAAPEVQEINNGRSSRKSRSKKATKDEIVKKFERLYFPGEPHQPPVNAYDLFVESFVSDTKLSATEAPRFWEMLPSSDKAKFQRKLKELKEKYIKDYKKFLRSLDEDQVAKYNDLQKRNKEREAAAEAQKAQNSEDDSEEDEASSSEDEGHAAPNNIANEEDSDSDENDEEKKSDSDSDSSSSSSGSSSSSSSDSDSSSEDSDDDDDDKKTNQNNVTVKKENTDSDSSDDD